MAKTEIAFCKQTFPTASQLCVPNIYCNFKRVCEVIIFVLGNAAVFEVDLEEIRKRCMLLFAQQHIFCEIKGICGGDFEVYYLVGYNTLQYSRQAPSFEVTYYLYYQGR